MSSIVPYREYRGDINTFWVDQSNPKAHLYAQIKQAMQHNFNLAFSGQSNEFFQGFDNYLKMCGEPFYKEFAHMGYVTVAGILQAEGVSEKKQQSTLDVLSHQYFANFQALEDLLFVGVDTETQTDKKWFPSALYTRSVEILTYLSTNGQLANSLPEALEKLRKKTLTSLTQGLMPVLRLDPVSSEGGKPIFEAKVPQKSLDAGTGRPFALIPVGAYYLFANILRSRSSDTPIRFEASSVIGTKAYNIATSPIVYVKVYRNSGFQNEEIFGNLNRMVTGFDLTTIRYYAYNLEESFYNYGVVNFRPEMLDVLKPITIQDLDTSRHTINYPLMRAIYKTKIRNLTASTAINITFDNPSSYANLTDFKEALITRGENLSNKDLHLLMKQNPDIFGNLEEEIEKRKRLQLKVLKDLKHVDLPSSNAERKQLLDQLLKTGVVRITAKRKTSNSILDVYATNNHDVLFQTLGRDYIKKYETTRLRLDAVKRMLQLQTLVSRRDLEQMMVDYNIQDYLVEHLNSSTNTTFYTTEIVAILEEAIQQLLEKSKQRSISPNNILYRNIYAEDQKELYGNVEASNIIAIEYKQFK